MTTAIAGALLVAFFAALPAQAAPITYIVKGTAVQGNLVTFPSTTVPFTNLPFTFTINAHTENVQDTAPYFSVNNDSVSLDLGGNLYTGTAGSSYLTQQTALPNYAVFAFVQVLVGDFWDSPQLSFYNPSFTTYDLKTAIGPLSPNASPPSPSLPSLFLETPTGSVTISKMSNVTFEAILPEPASLGLVMITGITVLGRRRPTR